MEDIFVTTYLNEGSIDRPIRGKELHVAVALNTTTSAVLEVGYMTRHDTPHHVVIDADGDLEVTTIYPGSHLATRMQGESYIYVFTGVPGVFQPFAQSVMDAHENRNRAPLYGIARPLPEDAFSKKY